MGKTEKSVHAVQSYKIWYCKGCSSCNSLAPERVYHISGLELDNNLVVVILGEWGHFGDFGPHQQNKKEYSHCFLFPYSSTH